jgi:thermostable 8-oxoguanine DNA glycosylase
MQLGYRFYNTQKKKLVLSCDIMFLWKSIVSNSKNNARRKNCINQQSNLHKQRST